MKLKSNGFYYDKNLGTLQYLGEKDGVCLFAQFQPPAFRDAGWERGRQVPIRKNLNERRLASMKPIPPPQ